MTSPRLEKMEDIISRKRNFIVNKIVGGLLFSVFGIMGFFYSLWQQTWNSAAWCLLLVLPCAMMMHFEKCYLRTKLHLQYNCTFFCFIKYFSAVMIACSMCALVTYITLGILWKEGFVVQSHYAASPLAFLAGFWYLILFLDCRRYQTILENE